jgi:WD40 repeat protein
LWLAVTPDGQTLATRDEQAIRFWILPAGTQRAAVPFLAPQLFSSTALSLDGKTLAAQGGFPLKAGEEGFSLGLLLCDVEAGKERARQRLSASNAIPPVFTPDGKTLITEESAGEPGASSPIKLRDAATGRERASIPMRWELVDSLALSPDGKTLAAGGAHTRKSGAGWARTNETGVVVWDLGSAAPFAELKTPEIPGRQVLFTPDGRKLIATPACFDLGSRPPRPFPGQFFPVLALAPDSATAAVGGDGYCELRDLATGQTRAQFKRFPGITLCGAFSPDGKLLAVGAGERDPDPAVVPGPEEVRVYDVAGRRTPLALRGHTGAVTCLAFTPDGRTLLTGGRDKTIRLWDVGKALEENR